MMQRTVGWVGSGWVCEAKRLTMKNNCVDERVRGKSQKECEEKRVRMERRD